MLWIDAHGDLNTPQTTPSGNVHGMPLAAALGRGGAAFESEAWPLPALEPARTTLIGVRSLDDGERALLGELDVAVHTMSEIDRRGIEPLVADALQRAAGAAFVHVSLDMDALDPEVAPGVGTAVRGGLSYREAHLAMELVAESGLLGSFEIVEVNPILDRENATAALAVELAASAFGAGSCRARDRSRFALAANRSANDELPRGAGYALAVRARQARPRLPPRCRAAAPDAAVDMPVRIGNTAQIR